MRFLLTWVFTCLALLTACWILPGVSYGDQWWTLLVFVVESALLTCTVGGSFGKVATRLRVVRVEDGGRVDPARALARAALVALVIPPLVFRPDRRGLHDVVAGSATVTLDVQRAQDQRPS